MINLEFLDESGRRISIAYDVHPASQTEAIPVPADAASVVVWLGTRDA